MSNTTQPIILLAELRDANRPTWELTPEGRSYLNRCNIALAPFIDENGGLTHKGYELWEAENNIRNTLN